MQRAAADANVGDFHLHDTQHTVATRVLRKSNLRVAQNLLCHEDVLTTAKYAHAIAEDIRAALNAASPTKIATAAVTGQAKDLAEKGKVG